MKKVIKITNKKSQKQKNYKNYYYLSSILKLNLLFFLDLIIKKYKIMYPTITNYIKFLQINLTNIFCLLKFLKVYYQVG